MEEDTFKANNHGSQWVAEDSFVQATFHDKTEENLVSSKPGGANSTDDVLTEQFVSLLSSPSSSPLARDYLPVNLHHAENFQDISVNYLAGSISTPQSSPVTQAEIPSGRKTNEILETQGYAAFISPPSIPQEAIFCEMTKQIPGEQEQLMRHQMEHLQWLIAEQQKIINFCNSGVSAALFPTQLPLGNYFQVQNHVYPQMNPLLIKPNLPPYTTRTSVNNAFKGVPEKQPEETESCLEILPAITEEKGAEKSLENASPSPFGVRMDTRIRNGDDRPIRPGIGVRRRTFEEFVEEQFKIDSQRVEKLQQTSCETKGIAQKSFLKCGEGIARFEKDKENPAKTLAKHRRRVSFDCRNNSPWLVEQNTGKLLEKCQPLKRRVSSPSVLFMDDKTTKCSSFSKGDTRCQYNNHNRKWEGKNGNNDRHDPDKKEMMNEKESDLLYQMNWSNCSQQCNEQKNEIKAQVTGEKEASSPACQPHQKGLEDRLVDSKGPLQLMKGVENRASPQVAGRPMVASPDLSESHKTETNQTHRDQSSMFQVIHGFSRLKQCKNEHHEAIGKSPEIQAEINPGFKTVNDHIIKATLHPERKQVTTTADLQREHHRSAGTTNQWGGKPLLCDSVYTSAESEDGPNSHCSWNPLRHTAANTSKSADLSDADYATDGPSGAEDHLLEKCRALLGKQFGGQEPTEKQKTSVMTSTSSTSSDSSISGKSASSFRKSPFQSSQTAAGGRDFEIQSNCTANTDSREFSLKPSSLASSLLASLFPVFKSKANPKDEREMEEQAQNRYMGKFKECEGTVLMHRKETSLLAQMKEEQAKAMAVLRRQISQLEAQSPENVHSLEECKNDKALKMQKKEENFEKHTIIFKEEEAGDIQMLKQEIAELQEEFRRNESQWHVAHGKLKSQVEALTKQNLELQDELKISELRKMEAERKRGQFFSRRAKTPVSSAILSGTSTQDTVEEYLSKSSHRSLSSEHVGRKTPVDVFSSRDRKAPATRSAMQGCELLKSTTEEQRGMSPPKTLHSRNETSTGRRTPHQMPFEVQKALPQLDQIQQEHYGRTSPLSVSNLSILKDNSQSLYVKGAYYSNSSSSEDATSLNSQNNDILPSTSLNNVEGQVKENLPSERAQRCEKPSGEAAAVTDSSRRNHTISNGRKTPSEHLPTFLDTERKISPLKPILCRRRSAYSESKKDGEVKEKIEYPDGKVKQLLMDGRSIIIYPNGTKVGISANKRTTVVNFYNGDIKKILPDQRVIYYYANTQTTRTLFPNGLEVIQFCNKQTEKYYPDGTEEIVFPDQTVKRCYVGGLEETLFPDGTIVKVEKNGVKTIQFRNGQKEIHTAVSTRREYPDGTIKTMYPNGQQETKYSSRRVRIKDEKDSLIPNKM